MKPLVRSKNFTDRFAAATRRDRAVSGIHFFLGPTGTSCSGRSPGKPDLEGVSSFHGRQPFAALQGGKQFVVNPVEAAVAEYDDDIVVPGFLDEALDDGIGVGFIEGRLARRVSMSCSGSSRSSGGSWSARAICERQIPSAWPSAAGNLSWNTLRLVVFDLGSKTAQRRAPSKRCRIPAIASLIAVG